MTYKLIALDLDDTLLNANKQFSNEDATAISKAYEKGVQIVLASGRMYYSIAPIKEKLNIKNSYSIAVGGAAVVNPEGQEIYSKYLSPISAKQVMRYAVMRNIYFQLYLEDGMHYINRTQYTDHYETHYACVGINSPKLMEQEEIFTSKILMIDKPEKTKEYLPDIKANFSELSVKRSQKEFIEIMNPEASKGIALEFLAKKLGIAREQVIAVGDSEIDISMIEYAGLGVAMENADEKVKKSAQVVTKSNLESGVSEIINKYILGV